jgi:hypothetical protein
VLPRPQKEQADVGHLSNGTPPAGNRAMPNEVISGTPSKRQLLERVRERLAVKHYSAKTADAYIAWIRRFIVFHGRRHPSQLGAVAVESFLTDLATTEAVSASTQNQALSAILFLYFTLPRRHCNKKHGSPKAIRAFVTNVAELRSTSLGLSSLSCRRCRLLRSFGPHTRGQAFCCSTRRAERRRFLQSHTQSLRRPDGTGCSG